MRRASLAIVALAISAAACSSGTPTGGSSPDPTPDAMAGDDSSEFLALTKKGLSAEDFKVSFRSTLAGQDVGTITWARRGLEASFRFGAGDGETLVIDDGSGTIIFCTAGSCFRGPDDSGGLAAGLVAPFLAFSEFVENADSLPGFSSTGSRTIAARAASCASWSYLGASAEVCVDAETGAVLFWRVGAEGQEATWEVVEFGEPSDADFEPTGDVQDFPS